MKKKFSVLMIFILIAGLICCFVACSDRGGSNGTTDNPGDNLPPTDNNNTEPELPNFHSVVIYNNGEVTEKEYETGTEINLKAKSSSGSVFVCWLVENEEYSNATEITYKVEKDVVIKGVYTNYGKIELETDGGNLSSEDIKVHAYGNQSIVTDGVLYVGYKYTLPVPTKKYFTFTGWFAGRTKLTDENGVAIADYDGTVTEFKAYYKENPYVNIVLTAENADVDKREVKHYFEDGSFEVTAIDVSYRKVSEWRMKKLDGTNEVISTESNFILDVSDFTAGAKYTFYAYYTEAYKVIVKKGTGTGAYAREETVTISAIKDMGRSFAYWTVAGCYIGYYDNKLALFQKDEYKCYIHYYDESITEDNKTVTLSDYIEEFPYEDDFVYAQANDIEISMTKLESLLIAATNEGFDGKYESEKETIISANFTPNIYSLIFELNCVVNGKVCITEQDKEKLIELGFVETGVNTNVFQKEVFKEYKEELTLEPIPEIAHYSFGNWQKKGGGDIPSTMPADDNIVLRGTFIPDKHLITIQIRDSEKHKGSLYLDGNVTEAYYAYGTPITITVMANKGFVANEWLNISSDQMWNKEESIQGEISLKNESMENEVITYVFNYTVAERQTFTMNFDERPYRIDYFITVEYTQEGDVTENPAFFDGEEGMKKFAEIKTMTEYVKFNTENCNFKTLTFADPSLETYVDTGLRWGNEHWNFSGWSADNQGLTSLENFTMPSKNLVVSAKFTIKQHRVSFAGYGTGGIIATATQINGLNSEVFRILDSEITEYSIPYGATIKVNTVYPIGYRYGDVKINGETIYDSSENGTIKEVEFERVSANDKYTYELTFDFIKVNAGTVPIAFYANQNTYTMKYYVNVDFENVDPTINLYDYIELDKDETEEKAAIVGGVKYYYLKAIKTTSGTITAGQTYVYNDSISLHTITPAVYKYTFGSWKKFVSVINGGVPTPGTDVGMRMPDENCMSYGNLVLNTYEFSVGVRTFDFEENPNEEKITANIESTESTGNVTDTDDKLRYYSAKTLSNYNAKGYDFVNWRLETAEEGMETAYINVDPSKLPVGKTVTTEIVTGGIPYVYKYRLNEDGTFTVFMTTKVCVYAQFNKKRFTVTIKDSGLTVSSDNIIEEGGKNYVEYGENFNFMYNFGKITIGQKLTKIIVVDSSKQVGEEGYEIDVVPINYDEDILSYRDINAIYTDIAEGITSNIVILTEFDDIKYKITYVVYGAQDNIADLDINEQNIITDDFNGEPYYATYGEKTQLMTEDVLLRHLEELNVDTEGVMYSGWQSAINNYTPDGEGFKGDTGAYEYPRMHNQKLWGSEGMDSKPIYYCYLINMYKYTDVQAGVTLGLNPLILSVTNYKKFFADTRKEIVIPEMRNGYKVVKINDNGFNGCSGIEKLYIGSNVKEIGASAFVGCTYLREVIVDNEAELTTIGESAFENCLSLQNFGTVEGERKLTFSKYVSTLGDKAFSGCAFIKNIEFTQNLINIGNMAFGNMTDLSTVYFDSAVREMTGAIKRGVFYNSGSNGNGGNGMEFIIGKQTVYVPEGLFSCQSSKDTECGGKYLWKVSFEEADDAKNVTIAPGAFYMSGISEIIGSKRLGSLGSSAFYACENLETVNLLNTNLTSIREDTFRNCPKLSTVFLPQTTKEIGRAAFNGSYTLKSVYYAENENGGESGFETIGDFAFGQADVSMKLERIVPYSYYEEVQANPNSHKTVVIGSAISIGKSAFIGCSVFERLEITGESTTFGALAFSGTLGLGEIYYNIKNGRDSDAGASSIFTNAGKSTGTKLEIGSNVVRIPAYIFYKMNAVLSVTIPETVSEIGEGAFSEMLKLETINYNASNLVSEYDTLSVFNNSGWDNIDVVIGENVRKIPIGMFRGVGKIKSVDMTALSGAEKLEIGANSFINTAITSVEIPYLKELVIQGDAFKGITLNTFRVDENTEKVVFNKNALSSATLVSANIFGKDLLGGENGFWGYVYEGTLVVTKGENGGYDGVVDGNITVTGDMEIGRYDSLVFNGDSSIYIEKDNRVMVDGTLTCNSIRVTVVTGARLIGAAYTADDFITKNSIVSFTELLIKDDMEFDGLIEITNKQMFEIATGKTAVFNAGLNFSGINTYMGNAQIKGGLLNIRYSAFNSGKIEVYDGISVTVNNTTTFGTTNGFVLTNGTVEIIPTEKEGVSETYVITQGANLEISENPMPRFKGTEEFIVKGTALVKCVAELPYLTVDGDVNVDNGNNTLYKLTAIYKENVYPKVNGTLTADVYNINTNNTEICYYGKIETALQEGTNEGQKPYVLMKDLIRSAGLEVDARIVHLDGNGYKFDLGQNNLSLVNSASLTLDKVKIDGTVEIDSASRFTANGNGFETHYISAQQGKSAIVNNGEIAANGILIKGTNGIETTGEMVITVSACKVESESYGIKGLVFGTVNESVIIGEYGIGVLKTDDSDILVMKELTVSGTEITASLIGITVGNIGDGGAVIISVDDSVVNGDKHGIAFNGGGELVLKGNAEIYSNSTGYENATVYLKDNFKKQVIMSSENGATIENTSESTTETKVAVMYKGHYTDINAMMNYIGGSFDTESGQNAVNCTNVNVVGKILQTAVIYENLYSPSYDYFVYDENDKMMKIVEYSENPVGEFYQYNNSYSMPRLYDLDGTNDNKVFVADKVIEKEIVDSKPYYYTYIVRNNNILSELNSNNVLCVNGDYELTALGAGLTVNHISGTLSVKGNIDGTVTSFSMYGTDLKVAFVGDTVISGEYVYNTGAYATDLVENKEDVTVTVSGSLNVKMPNGNGGFAENKWGFVNNGTLTTSDLGSIVINAHDICNTGRLIGATLNSYDITSQGTGNKLSVNGSLSGYVIYLTDTELDENVSINTNFIYLTNMTFTASEVGYYEEVTDENGDMTEIFTGTVTMTDCNATIGKLYGFVNSNGTSNLTVTTSGSKEFTIKQSEQSTATFNEFITISRFEYIYNATFKKGFEVINGMVEIGDENGTTAKVTVESGEIIKNGYLIVNDNARLILKDGISQFAVNTLGVYEGGYVEYMGDINLCGTDGEVLIGKNASIVLKQGNPTVVENGMENPGSNVEQLAIPVKDAEDNTVAILHTIHEHVYETVPPTCLAEGYDYCISLDLINSIVTEDGYTVSYTEENINPTAPAGHGVNGWTAENESQHRCNDCGALENHDSVEKGVSNYQGISMISINCTECGMAVDYVAVENGTYMEDLQEIFNGYGIDGGLVVNPSHVFNTSEPTLPNLVETYVKEVDGSGTEISAVYKQFRQNKMNADEYMYLGFVSDGINGIKLFDENGDITLTVNVAVDAIYTIDGTTGAIILNAGTYDIYYDYTIQEIRFVESKTFYIKGLGENGSDLEMSINTDNPNEYVYRGIYGDGTTLLQISNGTEIITVDVTDIASAICDKNVNTVTLHSGRKYNVYYNAETGKLRLEADTTVGENLLKTGDTPLPYPINGTNYYLYEAYNSAGTQSIYVLVKEA